MNFLNKNKKNVVISIALGICIIIVGIFCFGKNEEKNINTAEIEQELANVENKEKNKQSEKSNEETSEENDVKDISISTSDNGETKDYNAQTKDNNAQIMYVHIVGEVKNEGIVIINKGDRIKDAIDKAGGETELADLSKINLAFQLSDGQQVRIPSKKDKDDNQAYVTEGSSNEKINSAQINNTNEKYNVGNVNKSNNTNNINKTGFTAKININSASQTELEMLDGIGPSLADKIIKYRDKNGKYKKIEEIKNVSGIGEAKYNEIKDKIEV